MELNNGSASFFIKAIFSPSFSSLAFPASFRRARRNAADLFDTALMRRVVSVNTFRNERSMLMQLEGGVSLLFKMHGPSGNLILLEQDKPTAIFRSRFTSDLTINPRLLDRDLDYDRITFDGHITDVRKAFFTFGREVWTHLSSQGFEQAEVDHKWELFDGILKVLLAEQPEYLVIRSEGRIWFSLLPFGEVVFSHKDPIASLNEFVSIRARSEGVLQLRADLQRRIGGLIQQTETFLTRTQKRLEEVKSDGHFKVWADLVMASMHLIHAGDKSLEVADFDNPAVTHVIRLNPTLSPQKNAEVFYRKARNRQSEIQSLDEAILSRTARLQEWRGLLDQSQQAGSTSELEAIAAQLPARQARADESERLPYTEYECMGYRILVGRSATDNDALTFQHSYKEDMWMHARDCAGSHVLIKHKAGSNFPRPVLERAAALAAYHSKRKGESLCPVSYTPKKFVRKRKGDPAGMVVIDRESVWMATPAP